MKCLYPIANHTVYRFSMPVIDSNMYLIPGGDSCLIVDPCISEEAEELLDSFCIKDCLVLLTHEHYDHISGVNRLRELLPCRVVCSEICAERIADSRKNCAAYASALAMAKSQEEQEIFCRLVDPQYVCHADQTYSRRLKLQWTDLELTLTETPGHSPGSQVVEIKKHWYFTGDSLIPGVKVIMRLPGGSKKGYTEVTRPYLDTIVSGSVLFPGHGAEAVFDRHMEV